VPEVWLVQDIARAERVRGERGRGKVELTGRPGNVRALRRARTVRDGLSQLLFPRPQQKRRGATS